MDLTEKYCRKCERLSPIHNFKSEHSYFCRDCHKEIAKMKKRKERNNGYMERKKQRRLYRQHNGTKIPRFTRKDRAAFLAKYPFCMICLSTKNLVADHCHTTHKIRAVLCSRCNTGLGIFLENTTLLQNAIAYLDYFREKPE
jgi:hypothetical protein